MKIKELKINEFELNDEEFETWEEFDNTVLELNDEVGTSDDRIDEWVDKTSTKHP